MLLVVIVLLLSLSPCLSTNHTLCANCSYHGACGVNSSCICLPNWSDTVCNNFTDPCLSLPCANNGTCYPNNLSANVSVQTSFPSNYTRLLNISWDSTHTCNCSSSHSGERCELEYCEPSACHNHGDCLFDPVTNQTSCHCHSRYNGTVCTDCLSCSDDPSIPCTKVECNHGICEITDSSHMCHCLPGYTGPECSTDVNECESGICNYGNCVNSMGSYYCECADSGYTGERCDQEVFECNPSPCSNGVCMEVEGAGYQCDCANGWAGNNCGTDIDECQGVVCQNGGTCRDEVNSYLCECSQGYTGQHCQEQINYCETNNCIHGTCASQQTDYVCNCYAGYTGNDCAENINECSPDPCVHGTCLDGDNTFTCRCDLGYTGATCEEDIDYCAANPCGLHGNCSDMINNFTCSCDVGYTGELCDNLVNFCLTEKCSDHGSCTPTNCTSPQCSSYTDYFYCTCDVGYTGTLCADEVKYCLNNNCSNGVCEEETGGYRCSCNAGFSGDLCTVNESSCVDRDCNNGSCVEQIPKYSCDCYVGFTGDSCETKIKYCENVTCQNGTCRENNGSAVCQCVPGYYGEECQHRYLCYANNCSNGACIPREISDSYSCLCQANFTGRYCENYIHSCDFKACANNASCVDNGGIGRCICSAGYTGELCETKLLECESDPCLNGGTCTDLVTGYNCSCSVPYTGERCETELSSCMSRLCNLTMDLVCVNTDIPNNSCYCSDSVVVSSCVGKSQVCESHLCSNTGICSVIGDIPVCICPENYTGDHCQSLTDPCLSNPCENGDCVNLFQDTYKCVCSTPHTGENCESMVISCNATTNCSTTGSKLCMTNSTQEICQCHPAFTGTDCSHQLDCPTELCIHISCCNVVNGSFSCSADCITPTRPTNATYSPTNTTYSPTNTTYPPTNTTHPSYTTTPPINPCDPEPCNHGNCTAVGDNFTCECPPAYTGLNCSTLVDFCSQVVCANSGVCKNDTSTYFCQCESNFFGELCLFESTRSNTFFEDCANETCQVIFNDGHCDTDCASEEDCLFDGLDCLDNPNCTSSVCETVYGNKVCNKECNNEGCLFDGGDCLTDYLSYKRDFATGSLIILVKSVYLSYAFSIHSLPQILYRISNILHTIVIMQYVSEVEHTSVRITRSSDIVYEYMYKITTRVENSLCRDYCYSTAEKAATYLNAYVITSSIDTSEYSLLQITSTQDATQIEVWPIVTGATIVAIILLLIIGAGGVIIRKKRQRSMFFPRRIPSSTTGEQAALVESRTDTDDPDVSCKEYSAKRVKLEPRVLPTPCSSLSTESRPPAYELINQPSSVFHTRRTYPQTSIELDQLLVGSTPELYPIEPVPGSDPINLRGIGGYTPLSLAVIIGNPTGCGFMPFPSLPTSHIPPVTASNSCVAPMKIEMLGVDDLMRMGADVNLPNEQGTTPLHLAATYSRSDVASSLIASGAQINAQDRHGRTPLHCAVASGAKGVFQILLTSRNLKINHQSIDGTTSLMLAARHLNNDLLNDMLRVDANTNLLDKNGYTALHWAAAVDNAMAVQTLISHSADIDFPNCRGETPLFLSAKEGSTDCVRVLMQNAANTQITDFFGRYPFDIASEYLHSDIQLILANNLVLPFQQMKANRESKPNLTNTKSKGNVSKPNKTEPKRAKKKLSPPSSKVHPLTVETAQFDLSPLVEVKREPSSPSPQLSMSFTDCNPCAPNWSEESPDPLPFYSTVQLPPAHPYPTPPNFNTEFSKPHFSTLPVPPYPSHYPSPESSNQTISPTDKLSGDGLISDLGYPNHFSSKQKCDVTDPDWDNIGCS